MPLKVVALDIYGTVLAFDDCDYSCPPRLGFADFLDACEARKIKVVTSSDGYIPNVKNDLEIAFKMVIERLLTPEERLAMKKRLNLNRFDGFFQLDQGIKDFSIIISHYNIISSELLVIGDNPNKDICGALKVKANARLCPIYGINQGRDWDFSKMNLGRI